MSNFAATSTYHHHNNNHHHHNSQSASSSMQRQSHHHNHHHQMTSKDNRSPHNNNNNKKLTKAFDLSQIAEDPMDTYLDSMGLWKKRIARDGSCLFRAVAEQIYPCQSYHEKVRLECVRYMTDHKEEFAKYVTGLSYEDYLESMKNPLESGGQLEIIAMSKLYRRDFIVYQQIDQPGIDVTQNGYDKKIYLCFSYNNHFDAIFTKEHRDQLAVIQSLVYELLYDKVFGAGEQVSVARRLLRKSDTIYPKEFMDQKELFDYEDDLSEISGEEGEGEEEEELTGSSSTTDGTETDENESSNQTTSDNLTTESTDESSLVEKDDNNNIVDSKTDKSEVKKRSKSADHDKSSLLHKMPLPYKVAKSLDPFIYRNTAFDAWLATKKEIEQAANLSAISVLQPGDKCMVKLTSNYTDKWTEAFVQNMQSDSATVFVPELNNNHCVRLENLKVYNNANELLLFHYTGNMGASPYNPNASGGQPIAISQQQQVYSAGLPASSASGSGVQNVQKFVQPVNANFSKIYNSFDNKRRGLKKKHLAVKKSLSFNTFSVELPTLFEVEEQAAHDELFMYGAGAGQHHYYPHHRQHQQPHHHHHQSQFQAPMSHSSPGLLIETSKINHSGSMSKLPTSMSVNNISSMSGMGMNKNRKNKFGNMGNMVNMSGKCTTDPNTAYIAHQLQPLGAQLAPTQIPHLPLSATSGASNMPMPSQSQPIPPNGISSLLTNCPPGQQPSFMGPQPVGPPGAGNLHMAPHHPHHHPNMGLMGPPSLPHHAPSPYMHPHPMSLHHTNQPPLPQASSQIRPPNTPPANFFNTSPYMFGAPAPLMHAPQPLGPMPTLSSYHPHGGMIDKTGKKMDGNNQSASNPNNYLLMPAPQPSNQSILSGPSGSSSTTSNSNSSLPKSQSYHSSVDNVGAGLSAGLTQGLNGSNVYVDVYNGNNSLLPQHQQSQIPTGNNNNNLLIGSGSNTGSLNTSSSSSTQMYSNSTGLDSSSSNLGYGGPGFTNYEPQYSSISISDESLAGTSDKSMNLWNKSGSNNTGKFSRNGTLLTDLNNNYASNENMSQGGQPSHLPMPGAGYPNCFVVNIDGPINFNASHSLIDNGSDLPYNDMNTIRFFYNLGIEYFRLNNPASYNAPSATGGYYSLPPQQPASTGGLKSNTGSDNVDQLIDNNNNNLASLNSQDGKLGQYSGPHANNGSRRVH